MVSHKLSQIYKQHHCPIVLLFVVLYETRYYQHNYFLYNRPAIIIDLFTLKKELYLLHYIVGQIKFYYTFILEENKTDFIPSVNMYRGYENRRRIFKEIISCMTILRYIFTACSLLVRLC